ncbi:hypothetical protein C8R46DRAFT_1304215 [Mycena filopes]|nr:hypothetical protein C8R46DRAFT_1304215 [Mycena filopes]
MTALPSADDAPHDAADDLDPDADPDPSTQRRSRVRFRSRCRDLHPNTTHARRLSAASSTTSLAISASSSISAPLRSPLTEESCTPGWGTLGTRVNLFAVSNRDRQRKHSMGMEGDGGGGGRIRPRRSGRRCYTPTVTAARRLTMMGPYDSDSVYTQSDEESVYGYDDEALLSRHIDLVFGKWPGRLFNRQWWWWQLQPIMCCLDESDGED